MRPASKNAAILVAYDRGYVAARKGLPFNICPFPPFDRRGRKSLYHAWWQRGWDDGKASIGVVENSPHHSSDLPNKSGQ
jgi:hypothetical protein